MTINDFPVELGVVERNGRFIIESTGELIEEDGYLIGESGEIAGHIDGRFQIEDLSKAAWVLRKQAAARRRADQLRQALADEVAELQRQYEPAISAADRRAEFWNVYQPQLESLLRREIEGSRDRSLRIGPWLLGLRKQPARLAIRSDVESKMVFQATDPVEPAGLLEWAYEHCPGTIKVTHEFQPSKLPKGASTPAEFFETIDESETFYIKQDPAK